MCGEKGKDNFPIDSIEGSPPRARGEEIVRTGYVEPDGITPACAGRRHIMNIFEIEAKDHPRVCGEKK